MANNPYVNKVVYGGQTLIDISDTTATADKIIDGYTAYGANGAKLTGTASEGVDLSNCEIAVDPVSKVGTAKVGSAKTTKANYTPSGDIIFEGTNIELPTGVSLGYTYTDYDTLKISTIVTVSEQFIPSKTQFKGSGVSLIIKEKEEL